MLLFLLKTSEYNNAEYKWFYSGLRKSTIKPAITLCKRESSIFRLATGNCLRDHIKEQKPKDLTKIVMLCLWTIPKTAHSTNTLK